VYSLVADGATVLAGGMFASISATRRHNLAAVDIATGAITDWNPGANGIVRALVAGDGPILYAGGAFDTVGTKRRRQIAAIEAGTGVVTDWDPRAYGTVFSLARSGSVLYAGGNFNAIGGQPRSRIAAVDLSTGLATPWNPGADSTVRTILPHGGTVFAGGSFQTIGGASRSRIAALDPVVGAASRRAGRRHRPGRLRARRARPDALRRRRLHADRGGATRLSRGAGRRIRRRDAVDHGSFRDLLRPRARRPPVRRRSGDRLRGRPRRHRGARRRDRRPRERYPPGFGPAYALQIGRPDLFAGGAFGLVAATELSTPTAVPLFAPDPVAPELTQVGPVPSRGRTAIGFVLPRRCHVRLRVFAVQGRVEADLVEAILGPGARTRHGMARADAEGRPAASPCVSGRRPQLVKRIVLAR
jgi:hypothetical protein